VPKHSIYRNGVLYDQLDPTTHDVIQITRSLSYDMQDDLWEARDENDEVYYVAGPKDKIPFELVEELKGPVPGEGQETGLYSVYKNKELYKKFDPSKCDWYKLLHELGTEMEYDLVEIKDDQDQVHFLKLPTERPATYPFSVN
jgi:hypothetical protein